MNAKFTEIHAAADYLGPGAIEVPMYQLEITDLVRRRGVFGQRIKQVPATGHPSRFFEETAIPSPAASSGFVDPRNIVAPLVTPTRVERSVPLKALVAQINYNLFDMELGQQQSQFAYLQAKDLTDTVEGVLRTHDVSLWNGTDTSLSSPTTAQYFGAAGQIAAGGNTVTYPCWVCSTVNGGFQTLSTEPNGATPNTVASALNTSGTGTHTGVVVFNGSADQWFIDGHPASMSISGNSLGNITNSANNPQWQVGAGLSFSGAAFEGSIYYVRMFNRVLSNAEVMRDAATMQAIVAKRGVSFGPQTTPTDANLWVAHGDSRTVGIGSGIPYATYLNSYANATYQTQVNGVGGASALTLERYTLNGDCSYSSPTSPQQIASVWEGTNNAGTDSGTVFSWIANDGRTFHNCGFTTIVANDPSRVGSGVDALEQTQNAYWRGLWQQYYDGFVDFGADPNIGGTGAFVNTTYYYGDGVHFNTTGYNLVAQMFAREANYLKGSNLQNCTKVVTATYSVTDADGCTKFNPSAGSFTATLYNANDFTGRTVYLQNSQTSGSNVLTIAAAAGQTIDGAASITIPNGTMRVLQIVYNGTPGGGDSWHVLQ